MDSALIDFLRKDYPSHFGVEWDENTMQIRKEQRSKGKFEIRDGQPHIVQYAGRFTSALLSDTSETDCIFHHVVNDRKLHTIFQITSNQHIAESPAFPVPM